MKTKLAALIAPLAGALAMQSALATPLPPGVSDLIFATDASGVIVASFLIPETPPGAVEIPFVTACPICMPGVAVGLLDPGTDILSDLLTTSDFTATGVTLSVLSDAEALLSLSLPPVLLDETGEPQDISAMVLTPDAIDAGFKAFIQSDLNQAVPEPGTLALLALGAAGLGLTRRRDTR